MRKTRYRKNEQNITNKLNPCLNSGEEETVVSSKKSLCSSIDLGKTLTYCVVSVYIAGAKELSPCRRFCMDNILQMCTTFSVTLQTGT